MKPLQIIAVLLLACSAANALDCMGTCVQIAARYICAKNTGGYMMKFKLYNLSKRLNTPETPDYLSGWPSNDEVCYDMATAVGAEDGDTL